jgi:hypothetical protein
LNRSQIICIIVFHLFLVVSSYSQEKEKSRKIIVTGAVYNIESLDSLPYSEIVINKKRKLISDETGSFCTQVLITDTLTFNHLGFFSSEIVISDLVTSQDSLFINILMKEQIYKIPEVSVFPYKTYDEFIRSIVNQDKNNQILNNAYENISIMKAQIKNGNFPVNDGRTSYNYLMTYKNTTSNSIVLFSSQKDRGIIPGLKKILNRR